MKKTKKTELTFIDKVKTTWKKVTDLIYKNYIEVIIGLAVFLAIVAVIFSIKACFKQEVIDVTPTTNQIAQIAEILEEDAPDADFPSVVTYCEDENTEWKVQYDVAFNDYHPNGHVIIKTITITYCGTTLDGIVQYTPEAKTSAEYIDTINKPELFKVLRQCELTDKFIGGGGSFGIEHEIKDLTDKETFDAFRTAEDIIRASFLYDVPHLEEAEVHEEDVAEAALRQKGRITGISFEN